MNENKDINKPNSAATIYGEITHWLIIAGSVIAIFGSILYFTSGGYLNKQTLITNMWQTTGATLLWKSCSCDTTAYKNLWYLNWMPRGDAVAMLGIAVACLAGVFGMWGALWGTIRNKKWIYIGFAMITAVLLTLSALGVVKINA